MLAVLRPFRPRHHLHRLHPIDNFRVAAVLRVRGGEAEGALPEYIVFKGEDEDVPLRLRFMIPASFLGKVFGMEGQLVYVVDIESYIEY